MTREDTSGASSRTPNCSAQSLMYGEAAGHEAAHVLEQVRDALASGVHQGTGKREKKRTRTSASDGRKQTEENERTDEDHERHAF